MLERKYPPFHATNRTYKNRTMQHLNHKIFRKGCKMGHCVKPVKGVKGTSLHNKRMMVSLLSRGERVNDGLRCMF